MNTPISDVVYGVVQQVNGSLRDLAANIGTQPDDLKRYLLQQYSAYSRTLLARLLVLVRWAKERRGHAIACMSDLRRFDQAHISMRRAADELFFLRDGLWQSCVPPYDVRAALDVITRGAYTQLPRSIALADDRGVPTDRETAAALEWLRNALRLRRSTWLLPPGVVVSDGAGCVVCTVAGEYELSISAHPPEEAPWKLLRLRLLVGDDPTAPGGASGGKVGARALGRVKQQVQAALDRWPEQPLLAVHPVLHATCCGFALDALHANATASLKPQVAGFRAERLPPADPSGVGGVRLSYLWNPVGALGGPGGGGGGAGGGAGAGGGGGDGGGVARRAGIVLTPAEALGVRLRHEPPLAGSAPSASPATAGVAPIAAAGGSTAQDCPIISLTRLDAETLLRDAIRARSMRTLRAMACGSGIRTDGAVDSLVAGNPSSSSVRGVEAGMLIVDASADIPMLRVSPNVALALSPRDGTYLCLGSAAGKALLQTIGASATGPAPPPKFTNGPAPVQSGAPQPPAAGGAVLKALRVATLITAMENVAIAIGVPAIPMPRFAPLHAAADGAALWTPHSDTVAAGGVADARWLALPLMPTWGLEVRINARPGLPSLPAPSQNGATSTRHACSVSYNLLQLLGHSEGSAATTLCCGTLRTALDLTSEVESAAAAVSPPAEREPGATAAAALDATARDDDDGDEAHLGRLLPLVVSLGRARATAETLYAAATSARLACERLGDSMTIQVAALATGVGGACTPPVNAKLCEAQDLPRLPPVLRPTADGWEARVPQLACPPGTGSHGITSAGGSITFDECGAVLRYPPPSAWCMHDLLHDLQGIAMAHALLRQLGSPVQAGGATLAEASVQAVGVFTPSGRHVRIEWPTVATASLAAFAAAPGEPPPFPSLVPRLRVDGVPLAAVQRQAQALIAAGSLGELLRLADLGSIGSGDAAGAPGAAADRERPSATAPAGEADDSLPDAAESDPLPAAATAAIEPAAGSADATRSGGVKRRR